MVQNQREGPQGSGIYVPGRGYLELRGQPRGQAQEKTWAGRGWGGGSKGVEWTLRNLPWQLAKGFEEEKVLNIK